jgi:hypothetical protein
MSINTKFYMKEILIILWTKISLKTEKSTMSCLKMGPKIVKSNNFGGSKLAEIFYKD